jgi:methyl-accepting chemotaxis protein
MNIKAKLILAASLFAPIPVILSGFTIESVATNSANTALEAQVSNQLVAIREQKRNQIEAYFATLRDQVLTFSNDRMIIEAMKDLRSAYFSFRKDSLGGDVSRYRDELASYYTEDFSREYGRQNPGSSIDARQLLRRIDDDAVALQYQYIKANRHPLGAKDELVDTGDGSRYNQSHVRYHPHILDFLQKFGYYDIFLVEPDTGKVVYTVFKELDFATSLKSGPYADSGLGRTFAKANATSNRDFVYLDDFAPYTPSYEGAASFIASPIFDGDQKVGVLIFQMPISRINAIMTSEQRWKDVGLGASGETYLVGADKLMRSQSRFLIEDKPGFLAAIKDSGAAAPTVSQIDSKDSTIGLFVVDTAASRAALGGETSLQHIKDYRGVSVLSAYAPIKFLGLDWAILSEIDEDEAFAAVHELDRSIGGIALLVVLVTVILAVAIGAFLAMRMTQPIIHLSDTMKRIERDSDLSVRVQVDSRDEIGAMASSLNAMLSKFQNIVQQVAVSTGQLAAAAEEMSAVTVQTSQGIQEQQSQIDQLATAMNEMAVTVQDVAKHALSAAESANEANGESAQGRQVVSAAVAGINNLAERIQQAAEAIQRVEADSEKIGSVLDVIRGVAEQTNLLALNAAIEAARAGEQGRGFAVVADEVRTLAGRTQESTQEIQSMIESLQTGTKDAVRFMDQSQDGTRDTVAETAKAGEALSAIVDAVARINDMNTQIASAAEEQSAVAEEINRNVVTINQVAVQSAEGATQTARASEDLAHLASDLQSLVAQFKT